ncbi:MAG: hypothetical protein AB1607_09620 [Chloroflexota bacterium]
MSEFSLTTAQTNAYYEKYLTLLHDVSKSNTFKPHYEIAFYTPILFIKGEKGFEATFDQILFHLQNAYQKSNNEKTQEGVMQSIQSLLDFHIDMVETAIEVAQSGNKSSLIERIKISIQNIIKEFSSNLVLSDDFIISEAAEILSAYHSYFINRKNLKKFEKKFYPQLLHVYSKVLDSPLYSSELKLVSNSFVRVGKQKMLLPALQEKGLGITLRMLRQFGLSKNDFGESLRILVQNLGNVSPPPAAEDLMRLIDLFGEEDLPNRSDLERETIKYYQTKTVPAVLHKDGLTVVLETLDESSLGKKDLGYSLRILLSNLDAKRVTEADLKQIMKFAVEQALSNRNEIRQDIVDIYKKAFKPKAPSTFLPVSISFIVALFIYIGLVVNGINVNRGSADNFWSMAGKYIIAIGSSLFSSLYLTCAFLAVAIGLAIVVKSAISGTQERKFSQRVKEFENRLDSVQAENT